ncbi:MAG: hypothetical protein OIN88_09705 [Candidatus Methanoperedens sp.]|nr:hypothetical protein [Candidatus Methanoperedens sp.]MCZ7358578.1 hypothetical protein [Candidatus Methanoperedens sp.]HLB71982.1 hypothetical protein [Candidatus Methanoperedens sp.]
MEETLLTNITIILALLSLIVALIALYLSIRVSRESIRSQLLLKELYDLDVLLNEENQKAVIKAQEQNKEWLADYFTSVIPEFRKKKFLIKKAGLEKYTEEIEKLRSEILENPAKQDELIEELLLKTLSMTEHIEKQLDKKFEDPINV